MRYFLSWYGDKMFLFYTIEKWEKRLEAHGNLRAREERLMHQAPDWSPTIIVVDAVMLVDATHCDLGWDWIQKYAKGRTIRPYPRQFEFELENDAMYFKLVWG